MNNEEDKLNDKELENELMEIMIDDIKKIEDKNKIRNNKILYFSELNLHGCDKKYIKNIVQND